MKRKLIFFLWVLFGAGLISLLAAARSARKNAVCPDFKITIEGKDNQIFIDEKEIVHIAKVNGITKGIPAKDINLKKIETALEANPWISHVKMYFDDENRLCSSIWESEPIARVFTVTGNSFYIDSAARILPLHPSVIERIPVFTSFTSSNIKLSKPDSLLLADVKKLAQFIAADTFWNAFVSEININQDKTFDMIPTLGNTTIALGKGDSLPDKFDRLYSFYKQVWTKTGFNKYKKLDVRYYNQVVATRSDAVGAQPKDTATGKVLSSGLRSGKQLQNVDLKSVDSANSKTINKIQVKPFGKNKKETKNNL